MINNIKIGIKLSTKNFELLPYIYSNQNLIDFIEVILIPEFTPNDIEVIKNLQLPYAIHIANVNYGIDFGDINKNKANIEYINKLNNFKSELDALCYILHPESGDIELSIKNIKKLKIKPLALENMPLKGIFGKNLLASDPELMKPFFQKIPYLEFCFDINHAIKAAISKKLEYLLFINKFLKFKNPIIMHIAGGNLNSEFDEHLPLDKSQYDLIKIKRILLNYNSIINLTFETPRNYDRNIEDDLRNFEIFIKT